MQYAPDIQANIEKNMQADHQPKPQAKAAPKKKKNKPMSKYEQERNIQTLEKTLEEYGRASSGSQEPVLPSKSIPVSFVFSTNEFPAVEQQDDTSGDEESDSEEE
jgi:bromodomain-containing factor 1